MMVILFSILTGVIYPLVVTGIGQSVFQEQANGSLVESQGDLVGSRWIGQQFTGEEYFHPRPSATGYAPGPDHAFGSNYGPTNEEWLQSVEGLIEVYRAENGLDDDAPVPVDAVTGSASSLDPHISPGNARIQAERVAAARGLDLDRVIDLVEANTDGRGLGFLGEPGVNVLLLNLALDDLT
jgi:K+-transporting ATPase ATPase C chain